MAALQEEVRRGQIEQLKELFALMDTDKSHSLSQAEWSKAMEISEVADILEGLGLGDESDLFDKLDVDKSGELEFDEFFDGLLLVVSGNEPAKARDVVPTYLSCESMRKKFHSMQANIDNLEAKVLARVDALQLQMQNNHQELLGILARHKD
eukprot:gnl/MRDRNA2_/MRDRNA2_392536_c0_seq1.p1 gnl/MRDRNA2_/MRDRNA2_392536_c0~~gnl/MRDRNA2_/MRDRNA2_392536_c0_seq1.p1  ORF type:complete len:166 (+),score=56.84 gnl/MRDRNA2_/MRDRNA2_392536_c0_seq1:43-498(+)